MPLAKLFSVEQERRFRLWLAEMRATSDFRSSLSTVLVLLLIIPKYPFTGSQVRNVACAVVFTGTLEIGAASRAWQAQAARGRAGGRHTPFAPLPRRRSTCHRRRCCGE